MLVKIDAPKPKYTVDAPNYTNEMAQKGSCCAWFTIDPHDVELQDGAISAVLPRIGDARLVAAPFGTTPGMGVSGNYPAAIHQRDVLDHLTVDALWLDPLNFSLAVIATAEPGVKPPQHLAAIAGTGRALRLARADGSFWLKAQADEVLATGADWPETGPFLAIMSASDGKVRLRIRVASRTGTICCAKYVPDIPSPSRLVLGADQVAEEPDRPTPSPPRSWRGATFELLGFNTDILAEQDNEELALLDQYFTRIYGS